MSVRADLQAVRPVCIHVVRKITEEPDRPRCKLSESIVRLSSRNGAFVCVSRGALSMSAHAFDRLMRAKCAPCCWVA